MSASEILRFEAELAPRPGAKAAADVVVRVPPAVGKRFGATASVEGAINGHPFRATLARANDGTFAIKTNEAMRRGAAAGPGDVVSVALLGPESELVLPKDLRDAMRRSNEATALWGDMSDIARRDYVRWIEATNNAETRTRRIERTVEQLAEGKRRPCCVNTYEYSMSRIDPDWAKKFRPRRG